MLTQLRLTNILSCNAAGPQRETKRHPARGTEYGNVDARNGWPTVEGASSLYEMFYNRCAIISTLHTMGGSSLMPAMSRHVHGLCASWYQVEQCVAWHEQVTLHAALYIGLCMSTCPTERSLVLARPSLHAQSMLLLVPHKRRLFGACTAKAYSCHCPIEDGCAATITSTECAVASSPWGGIKVPVRPLPSTSNKG